MLEIADREFQAIDDANRTLEHTAEKKVKTGDLTGAEITPKTLKLFLDRKLGPDGRMSDWSYEYAVGLLKRLGFRDLKEVEEAISPYGDGHNLCRALWTTKQGQLYRFDQMLLAALGEQLVTRHPWSANPEWPERFRKVLKQFNEAGFETGGYAIRHLSEFGDATDEENFSRVSLPSVECENLVKSDTETDETVYKSAT